MQNRQLIQRIRDLIENENKIGKNLITYQRNPDFSKFLSSYKIGVKLDQYNEIILQEETGLELGGSDKNSFSVVFPISELELIQDGKISILGHEINSIENSSVDFGIFLLIGVDNALENQNQDLKQMNFISNSIEGYLIRTIPRRFWCRISSSVIKNNFSFEFLGNAIQHLYRQKFEKLIKSTEIIFINSYPESIKQFIDASAEIYARSKKKWKVKIEEWKKKIDCEYDWGCEICPYKEECFNVKEVLIKREEIEN